MLLCRLHDRTDGSARFIVASPAAPSGGLLRQVKEAAPVATPPPGEAPAPYKANRSFSAKQRTAKKRIAVAADALSTAAKVDVPDVPKDEATTELIGAQQGNLQLSARAAAGP